MKKFILLFSMALCMSVVFGQTAQVRLEMPATTPAVGEDFFVGVYVDYLDWPADQTIWAAIYGWDFDPAVLTVLNTGVPFNRYFWNLNSQNDMFGLYGVTPQSSSPAAGDVRVFFATGAAYGLDPMLATPAGYPLHLFDLQFTYIGDGTGNDIWITFDETPSELEPVFGEAGGTLKSVLCEMSAPPGPPAGVPYMVTYINVTSGPIGTPGLWTGLGLDDYWSTPENWDDLMVPTAATDCNIPAGTPHDPFVYFGGECNNLTVDVGATVTVDYLAGLTTNGLFTCEGDFIVVTDGGNGYAGSYIDLGGLAGGGTFYFTREMFCTGTTAGSADPLGWHYLAAPIGGFTSDDLFDYYVNEWDAGAQVWNHFEMPSPPNIDCTPWPTQPLNGLEAWSINYAMDYSCGAVNPPTGLDLEFMGPVTGLHTGAYNATADLGWNLYGNPYPSGLDMNLIAWDPGAVPGAAYYDGCAGNYVYWTPALGSYLMAPGLGFFTEYTAPGNFGLAGTERAHTGDWFWKSEVSDLATLEITGNDLSDITHIRFIEEAEAGFAKDGDFHKLFSEGTPQIYTTAGADKLAVNALPETKSVPMGMTCTVSGSYTISAIETSEFANVVLEDLVTGIQTDLLQGSYTFEYTAGDAEARFIVHFTPLGVGDNFADMVNIWSSANNIYVQTPDVTGDVVVFNMMGQEVVRTDIEPGTTVIPMNDVNTYYVVKVITSDNAVTGKVFIK